MKSIRQEMVIGLVLGVTTLGVTSGSAKTIGWWRFEEGAVGDYTTASTVFDNTADPGKYTARPMVHVPTESSGVSQATEPAELMPQFVRNPHLVYDPVAGVTYANTNALHIAAEDNETQYYRKGGTVCVANDAAFNLQTMTVEFFVKISPVASTGDRFLFGQRVRGNAYYAWAVRYSNNQLWLDIDDSTNARTAVGVAKDLEDGQWHHVAFTLDGTSHKVRLYVDDSASEEKSYPGDISYDYPQSIMFGPCQQQIHTPLDHELDEVRISDCVLKPEEFLQLAVPPRPDSTIAWWRFEEGTPGTATDADTVFYNEVDPLFYPARPYVHVTSDGVKQVTAPAELMPQNVASFDPLFKVYDPVSDTIHVNSNALHLVVTDNGNPPSGVNFNVDGGTVKVPDDAVFHRQTMTFECFVKMASLNASSERMLLAQRSGNNKFFTWAVKYNSQQVKVELSDVATDGTGNRTEAKRVSLYCYTNVNDGKWHHLAFSLDGETKTARLYVDYAEAASDTWSHEIFYENAMPILFGPHAQQNYGMVDHWIDEVRFSDCVLTPDKFLRAIPLKSLTPKATVTDDTLFLLDFEGSTEARTLTDFATAVTYREAFGNKAPRTDWWANVYAESHRPATHSPENVSVPVTNGAPVQLISDVPGETVRAGVGAATGAPNTTACHTVTNAVDNDWTDVLLLKGGLTYQKLFEDDLTFEVSFKLPETGNMATHNKELHLFSMWGGIQIWTHWPNDPEGMNNNGHLRCMVGTTSLTRPKEGGEGVDSYTKQYYRDGKWHHIAVVYRKTENRADFYVDGQWCTGADNIALATGSAPSSYTSDFVLGGPYYNTWSVLDIKYDDVRITRGALKPYQFLTTRAAADGSLGWATFDQDLLLGQYADLFPAPVVSGTVATDKTRPGSKLYAGVEGELMSRRDRASAKFTSGTVTYPEQNILAEQADVTVEFFVKSPAATAGTGLVRLNRDATDPSATATWALAFATGGLSVSVTADSAAETQSATFDGVLDDNAWHHVSVSFAADGDTTVTTCYLDYALVGTQVFSGRLPTDYDANLTVGDSGFTGWIDELRVSPGVLTPATFLWWKPTGMQLFLR